METINRYQDDENKFIALSKQGIISTYLYASNVYVDGCAVPFDKNDKNVRPVAKSGVLYLPLKFFSDFLAVSVTKDDHSVTLKHGDKALVLSHDSQSLYHTKNLIFLEGLKALSALGFSYHVACEDWLLAVGDKKLLEELKQNTAACERGAYLIMGKYDPESFTPADYKLAREKWKEHLVGCEQTNDLSNPEIAARIQAVDRVCDKCLAAMNKEPDAVILWGDKPPTESEELFTQYRYLTALARGYATFGCRNYKSKSLLQTIFYAMDWMCEHMYGDSVIQGVGWRDAHAYNWWYWYIAAPECITDIIFMLEDEITLDKKREYLKCFEWVYSWYPAPPMTRLSVCTKAALALEDPKHLLEEYADFDRLLLKRPDYSDFTHKLAYNMTYGALNLDRTLLIARILSGTPLEFNSPRTYSMFMMAKYMFEPAIYEGQGFMMFAGRSNAGRESNLGARAAFNLLAMIGVFGEDEDRYIKKLIKRNSRNPEAQRTIMQCCSINTLKLYQAIMADPSISDENNYEIAYAWYTVDRVVQHRNQYAVGIAMASHRGPTYESINGLNKTGWYTSDGAMFLYTRYDNAQYDGDNFIANINIAYHIPGTTEDNRERAIKCVTFDRAWSPSKSFAGGLTMDDRFFVAAMDYESMNFAGPDEHIPDVERGGSLVPHINDLKSKKAWFAFDGEIVSLSAGITSTMDAPVATTVEHRRIVKDDIYSFFVKCDAEPEMLPKADFDETFINPQWLLMEGHTGYVFYGENKLHVKRYTCPECNNQPYLEVLLEHGKNPNNAEYAYVILPYATEEKLADYAAAPTVEILKNSDSMQAVKHKGLNMYGLVFHSAGAIDLGFATLSVSEPLLLMVKEQADVVTLRISDPTHLLKEANVVLSRKCTPIALSQGVTVTEGSQTTVTLDLNGTQGKPYTAELSL